MPESDPRRPLRGAVVGYGFIAQNGHLPGYALVPEGSPRFEIVAIADVCPARRALIAQTLPGVRVYEDHTTLFAQEQDLDFVDIATPPVFHAEIASAALARGLHVLCEKPLTTNLADAYRLLDEARRARRVFYPSHNYKHAPVIKKVRSILESGVIGDVNLVTLDTYRTTHAKGVPEWRRDWRREKRFSGGGIAMDHGSHTFYLAFDWLKGYPTAVSATTSTTPGFDTEDNMTCTLRFPHGLVSARLSWTAGVRKVIYSVHGDRGAIRVEDDEIEVAVKFTKPDGTTGFDMTRESISSEWMDAAHAGWFGSLFGNFAKAIAQDDYVGKEAEDALRCVEVISKAYESARKRGREVDLFTSASPEHEIRPSTEG